MRRGRASVHVPHATAMNDYAATWGDPREQVRTPSELAEWIAELRGHRAAFLDGVSVEVCLTPDGVSAAEMHVIRRRLAPAKN